MPLSNANSWESAYAASNFILCIQRIASKTIANTSCKQVISGNDAAGRHLPVNAVSIMPHIFSSGRLFGTTWVALATGLHVL